MYEDYAGFVAWRASDPWGIQGLHDALGIPGGTPRAIGGPDLALSPAPAPYIVETRGPGYEILAPPSWKLPNRATGATVMEDSYYSDLVYASQRATPGTLTFDWLLRDPLPLSNAGPRSWPSSDPLGVYDALKYSDAAQSMFTPWRLPTISLPPPSFPGTPRSAVPAAQPAPANLTPLLIVGAAFLAFVLLVRR